ncbi:VanW family protein [Paenibacillus roseipurpureus]|uniref:VanW family protein n=1 Tax=Paenibacillus roseopurpureus TaxID=2918901 RepID=A0AA96LP74_9BACL|nr:VanW family protein [Paenibacillus sp. MBLB1832]WNR42385.1 VanW family protein [Paenibacillus sp. MBLB1832]
MRQRRKALILQPIKWVLLLGVVGSGSVYGLTKAGFIEWNSDHQLSSLMFWKSDTQASTKGVALAAGADPTAKVSSKPTPSAASSTAPTSTPASTPAASTPPSATPPATPPATTPSGAVQLISQAQSIVPVNANEKAWLELAGEIKLDPGKLFSYQAWLNEVSKGKAPEKKNDDLSHVASLLYEAALRAGMGIGERYAHQDNPAYAPAGFDVDFQPDKKDLTFYNSLGVPVTVGVIYNGETPVVTLNGKPKGDWKAPKITVSKEVFAPENMIVTDFTLVGQGDVKRSDGLPGLLVKVFNDEKNDGKNQLIYKDFYAPHPIIIAKAPTGEEVKSP